MTECFCCGNPIGEGQSVVLPTGMRVILCSTCHGLDGPEGIALMEGESVFRAHRSSNVPMQSIEQALINLAARLDISFAAISDVAERLATSVATSIGDSTSNQPTRRRYAVFVDEAVSRIATVTATTPAEALTKVLAWIHADPATFPDRDVTIDPVFRESRGFRPVSITIPPYRLLEEGDSHE